GAAVLEPVEQAARVAVDLIAGDGPGGGTAGAVEVVDVDAGPDPGHLVVGDVGVVIVPEGDGVAEVIVADAVEPVGGDEVAGRGDVAAQADGHVLDDVVLYGEVRDRARGPDAVVDVGVVAAGEGP